jgi:hypothetical protein
MVDEKSNARLGGLLDSLRKAAACDMIHESLQS